MAFLIDSSFGIDLERRRVSLAEVMQRFGDEGMALATVSLSGLLVGVHRSTDPDRRSRRSQSLDELISLVTLLPFDAEVARVHARITVDLTALGQVIGAHDSMIASTAIAHDLTLLTLDRRHFTRVPGLSMLAPRFD